MPHLEGPVPQVKAKIKEGLMAFLFRRQRSVLAVLAVSALAASILAVGSGSAGAVVDKEDHKPDFQACVGAATHDQGFTDVSSGHAHRAAINCLAYYRVTLGTGDGTTYSPNDVVNRGQMAAFLARSLRAVEDATGSSILPTTVTDQGFSDISTVPLAYRNSVNLLAEIGVIAKGGEFDPAGDVTRGQMALWVINFLDKVSDDITVTATDIVVNNEQSSGFDYFADVRAISPAAVDRATAALYELGVVNGRSTRSPATPNAAPLDLNYEPNATVNRGQMAAFFTRALAHTQLRPKGLTVQYNGSLDYDNLLISVREDNGFAPKASVPVDVFKAKKADASKAFKDGACDTDVVSQVGAYGGTVCTIDASEETTDTDGDLLLTVGDSDIDEGGTTIWAWTGRVGDKVTSTTSPYAISVDKSEVVRKATKAEVTSSKRSGAASVNFGRSVVYTVQLQDDNGDVTFGMTDEGPATYTLVVSTYKDAQAAGEEGRGVLAVEGATADTLLTRTSRTLTTDSKGGFKFTLTAKDPTNTARGDSVLVEYKLTPTTNAPGGTTAIGESSDKRTGETLYYLHFSDAIPQVGAVKLEPSNSYLKRTESGTQATNRVIVRVLDQYGVPIRGGNIWVALRSVNADASAELAVVNGTNIATTVALPSATASNEIGTGETPVLTDITFVKLRRDGTVAYTYQPTVGAAGTEQVLQVAVYTRGGSDPTYSYSHFPDSATPGTVTPVTASVYWAVPAPTTAINADGGTGYDVVLADVRNDTIVYENPAGEYKWLRYDNRDRIWIAKDSDGKIIQTDATGDLYLGAATDLKASNLSELEKTLQALLKKDTLLIDNDATSGTVREDNPKLQYFGYNAEELGQVSRFNLFGTPPA